MHSLEAENPLKLWFSSATSAPNQYWSYWTTWFNYFFWLHNFTQSHILVYESNDIPKINFLHSFRSIKKAFIVIWIEKSKCCCLRCQFLCTNACLTCSHLPSNGSSILSISIFNCVHVSHICLLNYVGIEITWMIWNSMEPIHFFHSIVLQFLLSFLWTISLSFWFFICIFVTENKINEM